MEELRKLEQLQRTLTFMQSHNFVSSSTPDSNRFLANLILLLLQPCGELNLDTKCSLISEYIPQIRVTFLEEASQWVGLETDERDSQEINNPPDKKDCHSLQINHEEVAMVGLEAMERANSTLEDLVKYQGWAETFTNVLEKDPFRSLLNVLECRGLLTERIREEFKSGEEYWALERKLCCALMCKMEISILDVMRAIHLKSFDYQVLNLLLYQLRGEEVNDLHMEFLSVSEFLVEISDDLCPQNAQRRCEEATKEGGKVSGHPLGTWSIPPVIVNEDLYRSNCLNTD
ncbi:hypothetical protein CRYUN_Cryun22dG0074000 [Craigia yunnanensis]